MFTNATRVPSGDQLKDDADMFADLSKTLDTAAIGLRHRERATVVVRDRAALRRPNAATSATIRRKPVPSAFMT